MANFESRRSFITKAAVATAGVTFGLPALNSCRFDRAFGANKIRATRNGRSISINLPLAANLPMVEVRLFSNANNSIFEFSDVSPYVPQGVEALPGWNEREEAVRMADRELRFPVVDLVVKQGMDAVIEIDLKEPGEYCFNGGFRPVAHPVTEEIRIPANQVEHWENALLLVPKSNSIQSFYLASKVNVVDSKVSFEFETLRDDWVGLISVHNVDTKELIANTTVSWDIKLPQISTGTGVTRQRMIKSLSWATKYCLNCQNTKPDSETYGGEFLLYDLAAKTRLRSDWPWAWGPSAKMMLEASSIKGIDVGMSSDQLVRKAVDLGYATLRQQILDTSNPAYGLIRATIEPNTMYDCGFTSRASTADTLFLVGWGWIPLYKATGDRRFLEASEKVAEVAKRLMDENKDKIIPQFFNLREMTWTTRMNWETSMGMTGLAALYMATGKEYHRDIMNRWVNVLLNNYEREDRLWEGNYFTKSLGYVVDGLIEVHKAASERGYLEKAIGITEHVLKAQAPDGSWAVRLDKSAEDIGIDDKGIALWAGLLIRLYKATGDKAYLAAGTKSLEWCMDHQYFGDDPAAHGGIIGRSWPSGIIYRHWFDIIVTYTVNYFGNGLVEALSLDEWK